MVKLNRFIQFNDESVDVNKLLLYERVGMALADAPYLKLTERKLVEFQPKEGIISLSVFWRHRYEVVTHAGRLSDVYLLTAGFWKYFSVNDWLQFRHYYERHPLKKLAEQLLLLFEEFRLIDKIERSRPGTKRAFSIRRDVMLDYHHDQLTANRQQGFLADAFLNYLFQTVHAGSLSLQPLSWSFPMGQVQMLAMHATDARNTYDMVQLVHRIMFIVEDQIEKDLIRQYYAVGEAITEQNDVFHYHDGMRDAKLGDEETKDTIEELFRTWHRESERETGVHLQYELEHGRAGKGNGTDAVEGNDDAEIHEIGSGTSTGNEKELQAKPMKEEVLRKRPSDFKKAGHEFGKEHLHVMYKEHVLDAKTDSVTIEKLLKWREQQKPFVRSFIEEMKKRIEQKEEYKRTKLSKGRLSADLLTMVVDERPKPFYRKNKPSERLDAVFGLLVDGSASMMDKLDETKKAVLLFHDVLRQLAVHHEISSYYEDANHASKEMQPNIFDILHSFEKTTRDDGATILSLEANEDNRDGFAIRWMMKRLLNRNEKHKFLLVFSDGEPSAFGYDRNGIMDTRAAVMEAEKNGVSVIHLFLATDEPTEEQRALFAMMFGNKSAASTSVEEFSDQTLRILRKLLSIVISQ